MVDCSDCKRKNFVMGLGATCVAMLLIAEHSVPLFGSRQTTQNPIQKNLP
jgi:hypothetical protein